MPINENNVTELLLRLCYHCSDAHKCETEEKCLECFNQYAESDMEDSEL